MVAQYSLAIVRMMRINQISTLRRTLVDTVADGDDDQGLNPLATPKCG